MNPGVPRPAPQIPAPGETIAGKYRLGGVLGRGGMGVVFDGHHELLDRRVAIKILAPEVAGNAEAVGRFLNEARAAAKISSDHVVRVLDVGLLDGGLPFMVMEHLEGMDLAQVLKEQGPLPIPLAVDLLLEAIEGVAHAHLAGIVHRDLKPSNLFLARRPDRSSIVKVLDFGISKLTRPDGSGSVTSTNTILGSPLYMAPEQLRSSKSVDMRADIWSLGVIAYELLTKTVPFGGENLVEIFAAIQEREVRPLSSVRPDVLPALDQIVRGCLQRRAEDRFGTVFALARALAPFGTKRAGAVLEQLEAHLSGRGLSFEDVCVTLPTLEEGRASRPPRSGIGGAVSAMTPAVGGVGPTVIEERIKEATSAPWTSTNRVGVRGRGPGGIVAVLVGVAGIAAIVALAMALRSKPAPAASVSRAPPPSMSAHAAAPVATIAVAVPLAAPLQASPSVPDALASAEQGAEGKPAGKPAPKSDVGSRRSSGPAPAPAPPPVQAGAGPTPEKAAQPAAGVSNPLNMPIVR